MKMRLGAVILGAGLTLAMPVRADSFGIGANQFNIEFVTVGNAGNSNDAGAGDGIYYSNCGGVPYAFAMGTTEISQEMITKATASGMTNVTAGAWEASQPAANMSWDEAAAFTNWLNTSTGHQPAYNLTYSGGWSMTLWDAGVAWQAGGQNLYRHKDAYYFLPSEDEWYKAAYHQNDGVTANYWDYPTGSNTTPIGVLSGTGAGTAVYDDPYVNPVPTGPATVALAGGLSSYGTMGQGGNVWEWMESAFTAPNDSASEARGIRGGDWLSHEGYVGSSVRGDFGPSYELTFIGFRVAMIPEPSSALLLLLCGAAWIGMRCKRTAG